MSLAEQSSTLDPWAESPLYYEPLPGRVARVIGGYQVVVPMHTIDARSYVITVGDGFVSDGSSVPRILWAWAPPFAGDYIAAAIVHDWLYSTQGGVLGWSRYECDLIFYHHMRACEIRTTQAWAKYRGVRLGGWRAWNWHQRRVAA